MTLVSPTQTVRVGIFFDWDREATARDIADHHDMPYEDALELWDREHRAAQEREILDTQDELLDAEARRQEHGAV